jgi:hypothetical protein
LVTDISKGLLEPVVTRQELIKKQFYSKEVLWRPEFAKSVVSAKKPAFTADDQSVELKSRGAGPSAEKTVPLKVH